jgi:beta-mannosidase
MQAPTVGCVLLNTAALRPFRPKAVRSYGPSLARLVTTLGLMCGELVTISDTQAAWLVRLEEPTGLYPRTNEVVAIAYARLGGSAAGWVVTDPEGRELPWQTTADALLFAASLMPGELPEYRIAPAGPSIPTNFINGIHLRKVGMHRVELGNRFFRVVVDTEQAAIVQAYNLTADTYRTVNLVETTPEHAEALRDDIHAAAAPQFQPVPGVPEGNVGWTSLGGQGSFSQVEFIEAGPLRGRVRFSRPGEAWELVWTAESCALRWRAQKGFRFTAVSAWPFLPFDRYVDVTEYEWPTGPEPEGPPRHQIAPRPSSKLPGGLGVYYHHAHNYGALGVLALDTNLTWTGIGSRRFIAQSPAGTTELALLFCSCAGPNTLLQARREARVVLEPLLWTVRPAPDRSDTIRVPAPRTAAVEYDYAGDDPPPFVPEALDLDGLWELAWCEKGQGPPTNHWRTVRVPGTVHTQWLPRDQIYSRQATWLSSKEWWYRRSFVVPEPFAGRRLRLQFGATDYYADIWLNGTWLGRHEGYIDPYELEVTDLARPGQTNQLLVRVWTPVSYYWKHRPYTIKGAYGAVDQKPDDITALGITRSVRLVACAQVFLKDLALATRLTEDGQAELEVELEWDGQLHEPLVVELSLRPRNFQGSDRYRARTTVSGPVTRLVLPVKHPQLWWTWDQGRPNLYTLEVRLRDASGRVLDGRSLPVGLREIEKVGWVFYLNRRRLFIRGTNYYGRLYLSEMDRAAYQRDLELMLGLNVNLIRLHCHFSNPEFYDLADELGVLVWQDFLEAWYPEDTRFSVRAAALYDPLIRSVCNHACVSLWATCDEESLENYRDLTKHLAARPALLDLQRRPVVRSTGRYGDAHLYYGWYGGSIWDYTRMTEPFVSELGATALPNYETLIKYLPGAWPISEHVEEWTFRRLQIPEAMRAWGPPGNLSLKDYIPRTQAYAARLFQIALERARRLKYNPTGGICHFHAIDLWPSVTMAAIDFDRVPTKVFYTVQRSFAPVCASIEYDRDTWPTGTPFRCKLWVINDRWEPIANATVRWRIVDAHGREHQAGQQRLDVPEDSALPLGLIQWITGPPGRYELRAQVESAAGTQVSENVFEFEVRP